MNLFQKKVIHTKDYHGTDRRPLLSSMDALTKVILILIAFIQAACGWGVKEIFNTLRTHEKDITVLQTENKSQTEIISFVKTEQIDRGPRMARLEEQQIAINARLDAQNSVIVKRLDNIEGKLDQVIQTGILDGERNRPRSRW